MADVIGSLRAEMSLGHAKFDQDIKKVRSDIKKSSSKMSNDFNTFRGSIDAATGAMKMLGGAALAAAGVGGLGMLITNSIDSAQQIGKVADKIGVSTAALQEYRFAAELAGVEQKSLDMALQRFTRRTAEAAQGSGELAGTLKQYGIEVRNADGTTRDTMDVLDDLANTISGAESEAEQLRIAFKAFDSEGAALVNLFKNGSAGADELRQKARDLGIVLEDDLIRNAEGAQDQLDSLTTMIKANLTRAILTLAPEIVGMGEGFLNSEGKVDEFKEAMSGVADVLRGAILGAVTVKNTFDILGTAIGATAAMIAFALEGDFKSAANVLVDFKSELKTDLKDIENAWVAFNKNTAIVPGSSQGTPSGGGADISPRGQQIKQEIDLTKLLIDETNKLLESERAAAGIRTSANETLFKELGLAGDEYFNDQANQILEQASKWKEAGVSVENVNEYLTKKLVDLQEEANEAGIKSLDGLVFRATRSSEDVLETFEIMRSGVVDDLQEIGFAATTLDENDVQIDVSLNDAATQGINNLINRIEALKMSLPASASGLVDVSSGGVGTTTNTSTSNIYVNQQISRSDISAITLDQTRAANR